MLRKIAEDELKNILSERPEGERLDLSNCLFPGGIYTILILIKVIFAV